MNRRVFILSFLILILSANILFAQTTSKKLSYQAVVRNAANELVINENLSVVISVLDHEGNVQYRETHASVPTNQNGMMWLWIGDGTATVGTMDDVVWTDATIRSTFTLPGGATVEQNTPVTAMPLALYADEVDTTFLQDYLSEHHYPQGDYLTPSELDDTLNHYYTNAEIDDTLSHYYTNSEIDDTLSHYYTNSEIDDTLSHYYTNSEIDDTLSHYYTNSEIDDTLGHYYTNSEIDDTLSHYYTQTEIDDTLSHYYTKYEVDTAKANIRSEFPTVYDSVITIKQGDNVLGTFTANQSSNVTISIPKRAEQVQANWTEINSDSASFIRNKPTNVSAFVNDAGYLTETSALVQTMRDSINDLNDRIEDTDAELSGIATLAAKTKYRLDSLAQVVSLISSINADGGDISELIGTIAAIGVQLQAFEDTICNAVMSCDGIKTMRDSIQEVDAELSQLINRVNTFHANVCDSVKQCVSGWMNDTLDYYYTKTEVDTAKTNIRGEINAVGTDVANLAASVDTAKAAIRGEINAVNADVTKLAASVDTAKAAIRGEIDAVGANVENLEASVDTAKAAIRGEINAVGADVTNLAFSVDTAKATIRGEIDAVGANVANLAYSVDTAKENIRGEIPTVYDSTITIKQGNNVLGTFTANQSSNVTINIPTKADQVQANWTETNTDSASYIRNKPNLGVYAKKDTLQNFVNVTALDNYYDKTKINDTLGRYYTKIEVDTAKTAIRSEIPTVFDSTITIKQGDVVLGTFTANQSSNVTINIPASSSSTSVDQVQANWAETDSLNVSFIKNKPTIPTVPTVVSAFDNDAGYLTKDSALVQTMLDSINDLSDRITAIQEINQMGDVTELVVRVNEIDTRLTAFQDTICDAVMSCEGIQTMRDSIHEMDTEIKNLAIAVENIPAGVGQVQANWTETDTDSASFIRNKPTVVSAFVNDAGYLTQSSPLVQIMRDSINGLDDRIEVSNAELSGIATQTAKTKYSLDSLIQVVALMSSSSVDGDFTELIASIAAINARLTAFQDTICNAVMGCDGIQTMRDSIGVAFDSIQQLSDRVTADKAALAGAIATVNTDVTDLAAKESADSIALAGAIATIKTDVTDLAAKESADSVALADAIATVKTGVTDLAAKESADSVALADAIETVKTAVTNLATKESADSVALADAIQMAANNLANKENADSTKLHNTLIDTANAIRQSIPKVNNGVLTIKVGTTVNTFKANATDSTTVTLSQVASTGSYSDLVGKPTKLSDFENDAHFITAATDTNGNVISTEIDPLFTAWGKNYNTLNNIPNDLVHDPAYVHTDNNYSTADKNKLDSIVARSVVNVQANWSQTSSSADDYIKNKPENLVQDANYVHTDNNYTSEEKTKLEGIQAGAQANVKSDWNAAAGDAAEILHKPTNLVQDANYVHTDNNYTNEEKAKLGGIEAGAQKNVKSDWTAAAGTAAEILHKPENLVQDANYVHTDNNYTNEEKAKLGGIEAGAQVNVKSDWNAAAGTAAEILNKPTSLTDFTNDGNFVRDANYVHTDNNYTSEEKAKLGGIEEGAQVNVKSDWTAAAGTAAEILHKPTNLVQDANYVHTDNNYTSEEKAKLGGIEEGAQVNVKSDWTAAAGTAAEILNKPTNLVQDANYVHTDNNYTSEEKAKLGGIEEGAQVNVKSDWTAAAGTAAEILNKPTLATVATSGSYNDLTNKPTIPTNELIQTMRDSIQVNTQAIIDTDAHIRSALLDTASNIRSALAGIVAAVHVEEKSQIIIASNQQTTLLSLDNEPNASYRVKLYINGVLVGDDRSGFSGGTNPSFDSVLDVKKNNGTQKYDIIYNPDQNEGYELKAGDKVMLYWFE